MSRGVLLLFPVLGAAVLACAPTRYRYVPVTTTSAEVQGQPAVEAQVPAGDPRGRVRIVPLGMATVTPPPSSEERPFSALYVRMWLENQSDEPWTLDQAEQRLVTKWRNEDFVSFATTPTGARAPVVTIGPRRTFEVDLLFELPPGATKEAHVEVFDVLWSVHAGTKTTTGKATFHRMDQPPAAAGPIPDDPAPARGPSRYPPRPR